MKELSPPARSRSSSYSSAAVKTFILLYMKNSLVPSGWMIIYTVDAAGQKKEEHKKGYKM